MRHRQKLYGARATDETVVKKTIVLSKSQSVLSMVTKIIVQQSGNILFTNVGSVLVQVPYYYMYARVKLRRTIKMKAVHTNI